MENNRSSFSSNLGFLMAAIGSAVGLGNIWGFPYKMGKSGGFTFLIIYLLLAVFVGFIVMLTEMALGRKTELGPIAAYRAVSKKYKWAGWLAVISPYLIMSFYCVLGGYVLQYLSLNLAELSFDLSSVFGTKITGNSTFGAMLSNPFGCVIFTAAFIVISMLIVQGGVSGGIEKFNKIGMPALFIMEIIVIIKALTLPNAVEGLKFMFVPGYAVKAGFIDQAPGVISVLGTAGGQMFFSLSLGIGVMITYGSYLDKGENLIKNSVVVVAADTLVALMAGLAVIPAAVANGLNSGLAPNEIALGGPKLLFVTLQDVFANMGVTGPLFGVIFYTLVFLAALSTSISLLESIGAHWIDQDLKKGEDSRKRIIAIVSLLVLLVALIVAFDALGSSGIEPAKLLGISQAEAPVFLQDWLDFFDCWSEGIMMPLGSMLMCFIFGWEIGAKPALEEISKGAQFGSGFSKFYSVCIRFICPIGVAFILSGQMIDFFGGSPAIWYVVSFLALVAFWAYAANGSKKEQ